MTSKEVLKSQGHYALYELFTDVAKLRNNTHPTDNEKELFNIIEKDLEEYEIAKNLIHELRIILYGDDEDCKTDFDIIRKCQLKILNYLEDKAKRLGTEKLVREVLIQIAKMIASGEIPNEVYDKYLSETPIGFMPEEDLIKYLTKDLKEE